MNSSTSHVVEPGIVHGLEDTCKKQGYDLRLFLQDGPNCALIPQANSRNETKVFARFEDLQRYVNAGFKGA